MLAWFRSLDRLLRGETTDVRSLQRGDIDIPLPGMTVLIVLLGVTYGACMGAFALMRTAGPETRRPWPAATSTGVRPSSSWAGPGPRRSTSRTHRCSGNAAA